MPVSLSNDVHKLREQFAAHLKGLKVVLMQLDTIIVQSDIQENDELMPELVDDDDEPPATDNNDPFSRMARAQANEDTKKRMAPNVVPI